MSLCVIDAWFPADPALVNSHWVAEQTVQALAQAHPREGLVTLAGDAVDRPSVEAALSSPHTGFAYFGHGRSHLLYHRLDPAGRPIPLIEREQIRRIADRWFHAFACMSGETLCHDAAEAGVAAYLGYSVSVNVEWDVAQLPEDLRARLAELVTVATLQLAAGQRSRDTIRRLVRAASDRLVELLAQDSAEPLPLGALMGLHALANQLHQRLELAGTAIQP